MPDVYAETVRKLSDYVTSRLTGSDEKSKRIFRDTNPSKYIIVGSLANVIEDAGIRKSSVQESCITLRFKTKKIRPYIVHVRYSVYLSDDMTTEEKELYPKLHRIQNHVLLNMKESFPLLRFGYGKLYL